MYIDYREDQDNSLFSAISQIVYGSSKHHVMVRLLCVEYLWKNHAKLSFKRQFREEGIDNWPKYCRDLREGAIPGSAIELEAISQVFNTSVASYSAIKRLEFPEYKVDRYFLKNVINLIVTAGDRYYAICESVIPSHYSHE